MGQAGEILSKIQMDPQENFSQETIEKFQSEPEFYREFVKKIEVEVNNSLPVVSNLFTVPPPLTNRLLGPHTEPRTSLCARKGHRVHDGHARREPRALQDAHTRLPTRGKENDPWAQLPPGPDKTQRRHKEIGDQAVRGGGHRA